ncbi:delta-60 repeat domain-containing protein [Pseudomonas putida CSV86]|uniref:Delta-60 repeat domain-containing protein n=1 Tax=Pseudomonas bharatica CSV86 TaxID=1005395 RepID=L1M7M9_9PSED|nr:delta-60 repeat domain-containing protein [Pseudomonas bharatica]NNJ16213.1 delta-60 repeat domain-containing protein [Pseudomonas bharatica CSV86]
MNVQTRPSTAKLDASFGNGGTLRFELPGQDYVARAILGPAKEIVAIGVGSLKPNALTLARFTANGVLDATFADKGVAVRELFAGFEVSVADCVQLPDTRLVALGARRPPNDRNADEEFFLACFLADGRLDSSFGSGGTVLFAPLVRSRFARALLVQKDGNLIAVCEGVAIGLDRSGAVRISSTGQLDKTFGRRGVLGFGEHTSLHAAARQEDGRLLFGGSCMSQASVERFYDTAAPDLSLAMTSFVSLPLGSLKDMCIERLLEQPDGRIVALGQGSDADFADRGFLARLLLNGSVDSAFNGGRPVELGETTPRDMLLDAAGRILTLELDSRTQQLIVRRVTASGSLDSSFGVASAGLDGGFVEDGQPRLLAQSADKVLATATVRDASKQRAGLTVTRLLV